MTAIDDDIAEADEPPPEPKRNALRERLRTLYYGTTTTARRFRFGIIAFDIASVLFFIATSLIEPSFWVYAADAVVALLIAMDLGARLWISDQPKQMFKSVVTWLDIIVIITLLLPALLTNFLFLRVVRSFRLLRTYRVLADLRSESAFFKRNEDVLTSAVNLGVFIFIMTALVYVLQVNTNPKITNYIDALYFTVTALTTTGFGDITLQGPVGRLLSVAIMIFGVALFLRLVQTIFRPNQVRFACPDCGLQRHDADAIHCKHCGRVINIPNLGGES
ncbi:MAG: ion channel [Pseudomonadota bacterium]